MTHCHSWPDGKTRCPNPAYGHLYADDGKRVPGGGTCCDCATEVITGLAEIDHTWTYRPGGLYDGHALIAADSGAPIIHKPAAGWAGFIGRVPVACSEPMGIIAKRSSYDSAVYCTACFPPGVPSVGGRLGSIKQPADAADTTEPLTIESLRRLSDHIMREND